MCDYFSGIITEAGEVLWLKENPVNHEAIIEAYKLEDKELKDRKFVRFEIKPKNLTELFKVSKRSELTRDLFAFRWDEPATLPKWVEDNCAGLIAKAWAAAEESWKIHLLFGDEFLKELKEKGYIHWMWGSAQITYVRDSAKITYVSGSAKITDVRDSAQITDVRDSAKITYVRDSAKITYVRDSAQITYVSGSAKITYVRDSAKIKSLSDFATARKGDVLYLAKVVKIKKLGKVPA